MFYLICDSICKSFGSIDVLKDLSFDLKEKEFLSLLGPSGCGKSTLLRIIAGLDKPDHGSVSISGEIVTSATHFIPPNMRHIGLVFQDIALFPHLSIADNIGFGLKGGFKQNLSRVNELLSLIGLEEYIDQYPHQLSGGQQQRVALARALAPKPDLVLLDEPFSSLDYQLRTSVRKELKHVLTESGVSVILVTHDQNEAFSFSENVLVLNEGKVVQKGHPIDIYKYPNSKWVASFVGESNYLNSKELSSISSSKLFDDSEISEDKFLIRPEEFKISDANTENKNGLVKIVEFCGDHFNLNIELMDTKKMIQAIGNTTHDWHVNQEVHVKLKTTNILHYRKRIDLIKARSIE